MTLRDRLFLILAGIFIAALVSCNLIFQKFFSWTPFGLYTFEISVGILPYPVTFLVTDIISELYGKRKADQVVISGLIASVFVSLLVLLADAVPQTPWSPVSNEAFSKVFGLTGPAVFASMTAYLTAQFIDIRIFHFWKKLTRGKHLWLRNNGSTIFSQLVDTAAVLILLIFVFGTIEAPEGSDSWSHFLKLLENGFLFKILCALVDTPLFYAAVWYLKPRIGDENSAADATVGSTDKQAAPGEASSGE